jgi:LysR family transcriptional regulator, hydrogen peroxide-inducible genes activator
MFSEDFVIAHGPMHRFAKMKGLSVTDLRDEPYCERQNCEFSDYIGRTLDERGVEVRPIWMTASTRFLPVALLLSCCGPCWSA